MIRDLFEDAELEDFIDIIIGIPLLIIIVICLAVIFYL